MQEKLVYYCKGLDEKYSVSAETIKNEGFA
jgi:hypothetical protein